MQKLILLPGWGMDSTVWNPVVDFLAEHYELISCDWYRVNLVDDYKERVFSLIDEEADEYFSLLGWSLGSILAIEAASRYKERIKQLMLVSGTSRFTRDIKSGYACGWPQNIVKKMKTALVNEQQKTLDSFYTSMFSKVEVQQAQHYKFGSYANQIENKYEIQELETGLDYLIQVDLREKLKEINVPTLLIHGEKDTICPIAAAEYISTEVHGEVFFQTMKGVGHIPFFTQTAEFLSIIKGFIEKGEQND